ncbi:MAG: glycosyltransferase [Phycisphaera sp.]|nr:glycosyltransferase [Phycisphaera sp.]
MVAMRVALLANTAWLDEELPAFKHLVLGLMDEQVEAVQVLPEGAVGDDVSAFGARLTWRDAALPWLRKRRLGLLAPALEQQNVNLIHAMDGRLWPGAVALAHKLKSPAVLSSSSVMDLPLAGALRGNAKELGLVFIAATEPIGTALRDRVGDQAPVVVAPIGVHGVDPSRRPVGEGQTVCIVVSGSGQADAEYAALLEAMRAVIDKHPQTQFFMDSQGAQTHTLWKATERAGLLTNVSMVPRRLGHRELLLRADALVHPQAQGRARSVTLQAMASGIPVIARQDPWLDYLVDGQTAWTIQQPDAREWSKALLRVIEDRPRATALGQSAKAWVTQRHVASQQVSSIVAAYHRASGESIPFPGG